MLDSRVYRGAEFCNTDHRLLIARLKVKLRSEKPTFKPKIDIDRFAESKLQKEFEIKVGNAFEGLIDELDELETHWKKVKETTMSLAVESCGTKKRKKEKWLTDEVVKLAEDKGRLFSEWQAIKSQGEQKELAYKKYKQANRSCLRTARTAKIQYLK